MLPEVGFVTIGQTPRDDVTPDIRSVLGPEVGIVERGALDGLSPDEIEALRPGAGDFPLITRLRDGSAAVVGKKKIQPLVQDQVLSLERQGIGLTALLCTDEFPDLRSSGLLLLPSRILYGTVTAVLPRGRLGVLAPLEEQREGLAEKWSRTGLEVFVEVLNPYREISAPDPVAAKMIDHRPDLIVLDCLGFSSTIRDAIRQGTGKPVLWPRGLLAAWIEELL